MWKVEHMATEWNAGGNKERGKTHFPFATPFFASAPSLIISRKSPALRLEPPTKNPSTSGHPARLAAFFGFTLPPYWMRRASAASTETASATAARIAACISCACSGLATRPVPIAQTGS